MEGGGLWRGVCVLSILNFEVAVWGVDAVECDGVRWSVGVGGGVGRRWSRYGADMDVYTRDHYLEANDCWMSERERR